MCWAQRSPFGEPHSLEKGLLSPWCSSMKRSSAECRVALQGWLSVLVTSSLADAPDVQWQCLARSRPCAAGSESYAR